MSYQPSPWRTERLPYMAEIMATMAGPGAPVVFMCGSAKNKSECPIGPLTDHCGEEGSPAGPHKPGRSGSTPGSATHTEAP